MLRTGFDSPRGNSVDWGRVEGRRRDRGRAPSPPGEVSLEDRTLACDDCGAEFVFTVAEQEFFRDQGFAHDPKRCRDCRALKRRRQKGGPGAAPARPHAPRGVQVRRVRQAAPDGAAPPRAARRNEDAATHPAICTLCGMDTQVPFVPDGIRPVYCLPCLKRQTR